MAKAVQTSKTTIKRILAGSVFDPRKPGPMTLIVTDANSSFLVERAKEVLRGVCVGQPIQEISGRLRDAISILAAARAKLE